MDEFDRIMTGVEPIAAPSPTFSGLAGQSTLMSTFTRWSWMASTFAMTMTSAASSRCRPRTTRRSRR